MKIKNIDIYNERMSKSIQDKAFFLDKISDIGLIFDCGCADAELFVYLQDNNLISKDCILIGYDSSETMIKLAKKRVLTGRVSFFTNLYSALEFIDRLAVKNNKILVLNSVLHELYSYGLPEEIQTFWETVPDKRFDYIAIRDMAIDIEVYGKTTPDIWYKNFLKYATKEENNLLINHIINISNQSKAEFIHFLLKHTYIENWERESKENYFAFSDDLEDTLFNNVRHDIRYFEKFTLPYFKNLIKRKFDFEVDETTHFKAIIKIK